MSIASLIMAGAAAFALGAGGGTTPDPGGGGSGPTLSMATASANGGTYLLTAIGGLDWLAVTPGDTTLTRKAGGGNQIGFQAINPGEGAILKFADNDLHGYWTDGGGAAPAGYTTGGLYVVRANYYIPPSFKIVFPAGTSRRIARVYVGTGAQQVKVTATLSDGSSPAVSATFGKDGSTIPRKEFTFDYTAASAGQTLEVVVLMEVANGYYDTMEFMGATYAEYAAAAPASPFLKSQVRLADNQLMDPSVMGNLDWLLHNNGVNPIRSATAPQCIQLTLRGTYRGFTGSSCALQWTGGTPTASGSNNTGSYMDGGQVGNGYYFRVPADQTPRRFRIVGGPYQATATVTARLSDGSAVEVTPLNVSGGVNEFIIDYAAASYGQTLYVEYRQTNGGYNVNFQFALLDLYYPQTPQPSGRFLLKSKWLAKNFLFYAGKDEPYESVYGKVGVVANAQASTGPVTDPVVGKAFCVGVNGGSNTRIAFNGTSAAMTECAQHTAIVLVRRRAGSGGNYDTVAGCGPFFNNSHSTGFLMNPGAGSAIYYAFVKGSETGSNNGRAVPLDRYQLVIAVFNGSTCTLYQDGVQTAQKTGIDTSIYSGAFNPGQEVYYGTRGGTAGGGNEIAFYGMAQSAFTLADVQELTRDFYAAFEATT